MTAELGNSGLFNERFAKNLVPLPGFTVPQVGEVAPDFTLPRVKHASVKLSDYFGQKPLLLAFTRIFTEKLFCPFCYPHIQELKDRYQEIQDAEAELLMITSTDAVQSAQVVEDLALAYPFLYDPACTTFRLYGAGQALGAPLPAQYVLDKTGRIVYRHLFSFVDHNVDTDDVLAILKQL
jgi:peroxiredoxin